MSNCLLPTDSTFPASSQLTTTIHLCRFVLYSISVGDQIMKGGGVPLTINPAIFCVCPKPGFPNSYVVFLDLRRDMTVRFVDIG